MKPVKLSVFTFIFFFPFLVSTGSAFNSGKLHTITGRTMGTFYTVKFISGQKELQQIWEKKVDTRLKEVNKRLSMYDPASEISIFNQQPTGTAMKISPDFHAVLKTAAHLYRLTDGAWDGTVKPLVDLWGFGTQKGSGRVPETGRIARALANTGFKHIEISPGHRIQKHRAVTLDLGSIAKGYGVDAVAQLFVSSGITDLLVEIGGELYGSGTNKRGKPWSVGISRPDKRYANQSLYKIIRLENQAIATSGTYRNFFEMDQKTFAHIIDPRTGFPVDNNIVSASVIAQDCTLADGLATALMVMDVQKGIDLVNRLDSTECLIIEKRGQTLVNHPSKKFNDLVKE